MAFLSPFLFAIEKKGKAFRVKDLSLRQKSSIFATSLVTPARRRACESATARSAALSAELREARALRAAGVWASTPTDEDKGCGVRVDVGIDPYNTPRGISVEPN